MKNEGTHKKFKIFSVYKKKSMQSVTIHKNVMSSLVSVTPTAQIQHKVSQCKMVNTHIFYIMFFVNTITFYSADHYFNKKITGCMSVLHP